MSILRNIILIGAKPKIKKIFPNEKEIKLATFDIINLQKTVSIEVGAICKTFQLEAFSDFYNTLETTISSRVKNIQNIERIFLTMDFENKKVDCVLYCLLDNKRTRLQINDVF